MVSPFEKAVQLVHVALLFTATGLRVHIYLLSLIPLLAQSFKVSKARSLIVGRVCVQVHSTTFDDTIGS